ncbi:MAG: hypothetical protein ACI9HY_003954, partial [Planctomycetaceae bacterium]
MGERANSWLNIGLFGMAFFVTGWNCCDYRIVNR